MPAACGCLPGRRGRPPCKPDGVARTRRAAGSAGWASDKGYQFGEAGAAGPGRREAAAACHEVAAPARKSSAPPSAGPSPLTIPGRRPFLPVIPTPGRSFSFSLRHGGTSCPLYAGGFCVPGRPRGLSRLIREAGGRGLAGVFPLPGSFLKAGLDRCPPAGGRCRNRPESTSVPVRAGQIRVGLPAGRRHFFRGWPHRGDYGPAPRHPPDNARWGKDGPGGKAPLCAGPGGSLPPDET